MTTLTMKINGMSCGHCVHAVTKALGAVPGVEVDKVEIGSAIVRFDPSTVHVERLKDVVEDEGYEVLETA